MSARAAMLLTLLPLPCIALGDVSGYAAPILLSDSPDLIDDDPGVGASVALDARADGDGPIEGVLRVHGQALPYGDGVATTHLVREAYGEYRGGAFDLRVGKQLILTGVADGYNPTNVISPANLRLQHYEDHGERFGVWAAQIGVYASDAITITASYSPFHVSSVLPAAPALGPLAPDEEPSSEWRDGGALRIDYRGQGLDAGLTAYAGAMQTPMLAFDGTGYGYEVGDMTMLGGDLVWVSGSYRTFVELAHTDVERDGGLGPRDETALVSGLEYEATPELRIIGQVFGRLIDDPAPLPALPGAAESAAVNRVAYGQFETEQTGASLSARYSTPDASLSGDLSASSWFDDDLYLRARLAYRLGDTTALYLRADRYDGDADTIFGSLKDASRVAAEYRIYF